MKFSTLLALPEGVDVRALEDLRAALDRSLLLGTPGQIDPRTLHTVVEALEELAERTAEMVPSERFEEAETERDEAKEAQREAEGKLEQLRATSIDFFVSTDKPGARQRFLENFKAIFPEHKDLRDPLAKVLPLKPARGRGRG